MTIYAERLARGLARRGHAVTVLTSRFAPSLPEREEHPAGLDKFAERPVAFRSGTAVVYRR